MVIVYLLIYKYLFELSDYFIICNCLNPVYYASCVATTKSEFGVAEVYNITSRDEDDLVNAIANVGPVSVAFDVASDFKLYSHGVYDSFDAETNSTVCTSDAMSVNHAVSFDRWMGCSFYWRV